MLAMADQTAGPNGLNIFVGNFDIFIKFKKNSKIYICFSKSKKTSRATRLTSARKEKSSDKNIFDSLQLRF